MSKKITVMNWAELREVVGRIIDDNPEHRIIIEKNREYPGWTIVREYPGWTIVGPPRRRRTHA